MREKLSNETSLIQEILSGLAKIRIEKDGWLDSESEELEKETQAFKIGECLRPFYLAVKDDPELFNPLPLPQDILLKDTENFLKLVQKNGFFPSPYSQIPGGVDQYVDFAAFNIEFCALTHDFWENDTRGRNIVKLSKTIAQTALDFLLDSQNSLVDNQGCRWGGTNKYMQVKKGKVFYTDTFFTSVVMIALQNYLEHSVLGLSVTKRDEVRKIIRQAGQWICSRFDDRFITGNETKTNRQLIYSTWGLRALVETFHTQEQDVRRVLPALTNAYLTALQSKLAEEGFLNEQEYLTIFSEEVATPLYYEDRSGLGGILLTLISLRSIPDIEELLEETEYVLIFERLLNSLMSLRTPTTKLWYRQGLILSIHSYLVEAFLMLNRKGKGFGGKLEVTGPMIRNAVREALSDEVIISSIQQMVYERLLRIVEGTKQERTIQEKMKELRSTPSIQGSKPKTNPKRARSQTRRRKP